MLSPLIEQNRTLLENRNSYMLPFLPRISSMLNDHEKNAQPDYFDAFQCMNVPKGEYLLREGTVCKFIWFLKEGLARIFDQKNGKEVTRYFFSAAELIDVHCSSMLQIPSEVNIQVIKNSVVYFIRRTTWEKLAKDYPVIAEIEKLTLQAYLIWLDRRMYLFQHTNSLEKYLYVQHELAPIINDISVTHIASFINTTIETVSRARRAFACKSLRNL